MNKLLFRPMTWEDAGPLFVWRCDRDTVAASFRDPPTWEQHLDWMNATLIDWPNRHYMGMTKLGMPVVTVSINSDNEVSLMVHPGLRRQGFAKQALQWAQTTHELLTAKVKIGNTAGLKLFTACGFEIVDADDPVFVVLFWRKGWDQQ